MKTGHQRIAASPPPPSPVAAAAATTTPAAATPAAATPASAGGSGGGGFMSTLINIGVGLLLLVLLYACRSKLFGFLAPYFGGGGGSEMTPAKDIKFKKVGRKPDDDAASTTSCGLSGGRRRWTRSLRNGPRG